MKAYHFIKYGSDTTLEQFSNSNEDVVYCFDFEDSIQDCFQPEHTPDMKSRYRNYFKKLMNYANVAPGTIHIGVRVNGANTSEYSKDLLALQGIGHISSIFLPKTSHAGQIQTLEQDLNRLGIVCDEIIPVIETKEGMINMDSILKSCSTKIKRVALGHCDYNADNGIFPFFHQDSREYWSWVLKIEEQLKVVSLGFINSPFLRINDDDAFVSMLHSLNNVCRNPSQIVLNKRQAMLCKQFICGINEKMGIGLKNRLDLRVPEYYAEKFIASFENTCMDKGFALDENKTVLSPQEYFSAKEYLTKGNIEKLNFTFTGGCFPVQGSVAFEELFHQVLKRKMEANGNLEFNVNIIRYERFQNCLSKIATYLNSNPIDILVFSVRPEPFIRRVKLFYRFAAQPGNNPKWTININRLNKSNVDNVDMLGFDSGMQPARSYKRSWFHKLFIDLNYTFGFLVGNYHFALRDYNNLVRDISGFCTENNIQFYVMGPPIRYNTHGEKLLSAGLERFIKNSGIVSAEKFIVGSEIKMNGENVFSEDGIYATERYHEQISNRIFQKIRKLIKTLPEKNVVTQSEYVS